MIEPKIPRKIQFTAEYEDDNKTLNFLDTIIINSGDGQYDFKVHRQNAITNVQIKHTCCHDDQIKYGVFKGFIRRAKEICSPQYLKEEVEFLINVFIENGYKETTLRKITANHNYIRQLQHTNSQ